MSKPTAEQFGAYQKAFAYFNETLFGGSLPECILNFSRKGKTRGFFASERWQKGESNTHEISLNPDVLDREPIETMSTLVHEMVHLWQFEYGNYSKNGYHNSEWAAKMESIGLMPSNTGEPGGSRTGSKMTHYIIYDGLFQKAFEAMPSKFLIPWASFAVKSQGPRKDKIKYTCPKCNSNVWGKTDLSIVCGICKEIFVSADV